jgi:hypothetical protein
MGQNNDTTERGDKQGQQGGQMDKKNQQDQQQQAQKRGLPEENTAGSSNKDKSANQSGANNKK